MVQDDSCEEPEPVLLESVALSVPDIEYCSDGNLSGDESDDAFIVSVGILKSVSEGKQSIQEEPYAAECSVSTHADVLSSADVKHKKEPSSDSGRMEQFSVLAQKLEAFSLPEPLPGNTDICIDQVKEKASKVSAPCIEYDPAPQSDRNLEQLSEILLDSDASMSDEEILPDGNIQESCVKTKSLKKVRFSDNVKENIDSKYYYY